MKEIFWFSWSASIQKKTKTDYKTLVILLKNIFTIKLLIYFLCNLIEENHSVNQAIGIIKLRMRTFKKIKSNFYLHSNKLENMLLQAVVLLKKIMFSFLKVYSFIKVTLYIHKVLVTTQKTPYLLQKLV